MAAELSDITPSDAARLVGSGTGAVTRRRRPWLCPGFPPSCPGRALRDAVSSSRRIARSVRISRTTRSCTFHDKGYAAYRRGATDAPS
jgi:hypothetical protein